MSSNVNFLKTTTELIETNPEIKSFIYQQILEFDPFVTPETLILVIARDPNQSDPDSNSEFSDDEQADSSHKTGLHRIAIVLKEDDSSLEAEAFHEDIYQAIKLAKEKLILELIEIQNEVENPTERLAAIIQAGSASQIH